VTSSFRHAALLRVSGSDTILLASDAPILPERAEVDAAQKLVDALPDVGGDLRKHLETDDVRSLLLNKLLLDDAGLRQLASRSASTDVNTDLNLRLEFDAPLRLFNSDLNPEVEMGPTILGAVQGPWLVRMIEEWGCSTAQIPGLRSLASLLSRNRLEGPATAVLDRALRLSPDDPSLLADRTIGAKEWTDEEVVAAAGKILERSPDEAFRVGAEASRRSRYRAAADIYRRILAVHPASATGWANLAWALESLKEREPAREAWLKAAVLDPLNASIRKDVDAFEKRRADRPK
jgi:tetratricopeptide (TPR) repeat protein